MADDAASETQVTFHIKSSNEGKYTVTVPTSLTVADLKQKLSTSEYANIPAERQRLIYSGRVLKDPDTVASAKIKEGNTVHLVKGAESNARQNPSNQGSSSSTTGTGSTPAAANVPTNIAAGTGNNPLAALTGARYAGFHGLPGADAFGPDGGLGAPPDPDQVLRMLDNPMFVSQMNEAMNSPAFIEMMSQNPMLRDNPMARQMLQSPEFRRMMLNPDMIRMQLNMQRAMGNNSGGSAFPAPGVTDTTPQNQQQGQGQNQTNTSPSGQNPALNPFGAGMFGGMPSANPAANPFAALFNPTQQPQNSQQTPASTTPSTSPPPASAGQGNNNPPSESTGTQQQQPQNPFGLFGAPNTGANQDNPFAQITQQMMQNPEAMRNMMQMMYGGDQNQAGSTVPPMGGAAGANPFGNLFNPELLQNAMRGGMGSPQPPDNRPPEERYAEQLRQLNDMGFFEFERNIQALRRSGGSVEGAVQLLLDGI